MTPADILGPEAIVVIVKVTAVCFVVFSIIGLIAAIKESIR